MSTTIVKRVYLTFPAGRIREPIICQMYDQVGVQFNLRTASVTDEIGIVGLEFEGPREKIDEAMEFFRERGVRVEPIELNVIGG